MSEDYYNNHKLPREWPVIQHKRMVSVVSFVNAWWSSLFTRTWNETSVKEETKAFKTILNYLILCEFGRDNSMFKSKHPGKCCLQGKLSYSLWELNSTHSILYIPVTPAGSTNNWAVCVNNGRTTYLPTPVQTLHSVQQQ